MVNVETLSRGKSTQRHKPRATDFGSGLAGSCSPEAGGVVSSPVVSDTQGHASAIWYDGPSAGQPQSLEARVGSISVTFAASAIQPAIGVVVSGSNSFVEWIAGDRTSSAAGCIVASSTRIENWSKRPRATPSPSARGGNITVSSTHPPPPCDADLARVSTLTSTVVATTSSASNSAISPVRQSSHSVMDSLPST